MEEFVRSVASGLFSNLVYEIGKAAVRRIRAHPKCKHMRTPKHMYAPKHVG